MSANNPLVAIVGRPNVGKSSLFNRLIGERKSIVESEPGVTRDRVYGEGEWQGKQFSLVDTGGLVPGVSEGIINLVKRQVETAIEEADVLLFLVDIQEGITSIDEEIRRGLRKVDKPIILVANKVDNLRLEEDLSDFYRLGLSRPIPISVSHGLNINELLDKVVEVLPSEGKGKGREGIKVAVVGRPNVGKSSFINTLLQEERLIVDEEPGTTRDAVDTIFRLGEEKFIFVDTAGMRPRSKVRKSVEIYSSILARKSIERCDIALFLTDAREGITFQDSRIASYIWERGRGCIIGVNKWDLIVERLKFKVESLKAEAKDKTSQELLRLEIQRAKEEGEEIVRDRLRFLKFAPLAFFSALTGEGVFGVINLMRKVTRQQTARPSLGILKRVFEEAKAHYRPPGGLVKPVTLHRISQVGIKPPTFVLFADHPQFIVKSYLNYLDNRLRRAFGFEGTPIKIILRKGR